jgi:hypothetical protein
MTNVEQGDAFGFDWESDDGHDRIREIAKVVRAADERFEAEGGTTRHWVRDYFIPRLEAAGFTIVPRGSVRDV